VKLSPSTCPECRERVEALEVVVEAVALVTVEGYGVFQHVGDGDVDWSSARPTMPKGWTAARCPRGHRFRVRVKREESPAKACGPVPRGARAVPVRDSARPAIVDEDDYARATAREWTLTGGYATTSITRGGHRTVVTLGRYLADAPSGHIIGHRNGDRLDCRRENLKTRGGGNVVPPKGRRHRWGVRLSVDGHRIRLWGWPSERYAREMAALADERAIRLRGKGLPFAEIKREIEEAVGRRVE
jgi:hypothetical protein